MVALVWEPRNERGVLEQLGRKQRVDQAGAEARKCVQ